MYDRGFRQLCGIIITSKHFPVSRSVCACIVVDEEGKKHTSAVSDTGAAALSAQRAAAEALQPLEASGFRRKMPDATMGSLFGVLQRPLGSATLGTELAAG